MDNFAPVLIPTLNRHVHFKRCVDSLSACTHADKTDLYVAFDYPLTESHRDGYRKINEYLPTIKRFKSVNIIRREKNFGASGNIADARKTIFEKYDRMILSEDDNEFSPNFLDYINKGLTKFENKTNIFAICGYLYPVKIPKDYKHDYFFYKGFSAWGYGIWRNRHENMSFKTEDLKVFLMNLSNVKKLVRKSYPHLLGYVNHVISKKPFVGGDGYIDMDLIKTNRYCLFPTISKVRNHGHDGSGVNCGLSDNDIYVKQVIDKKEKFIFANNICGEDKEVNKAMNTNFKISFLKKCKCLIKYCLFRIKFIGSL